MSRFDITLGLLAMMATIAVIAVYGMNEEHRMLAAARGWSVRSVEGGAAMFDQYCASCHGPNAVGLMCPPLNEKSGLHGGNLGPGVAWRLEELGWDRTLLYEYVYGVISTGRTISTRPDRYLGNRIPPTPLPAGAPTPLATSSPLMAMPAWAQIYGGPLRPDQIRDLTNYVVAFNDYFPKPEVKGALPTAKALAATTRPTPRPTSSVTTTSSALTPLERGAELYAANPCGSCHILPGVSAGPVCPDLTGLAATAALRIKAADYTGTATTPEEYVRESIKNPTAYLAPGAVAGAVMPPLPLSDADIAALAAYLLQQGG